MRGNVDGRAGDEVIAGGYEYSSRFAEREMMVLLSCATTPLKIFDPRQHLAGFGHSVANTATLTAMDWTNRCSKRKLRRVSLRPITIYLRVFSWTYRETFNARSLWTA